MYGFKYQTYKSDFDFDLKQLINKNVRTHAYRSSSENVSCLFMQWARQSLTKTSSNQEEVNRVVNEFLAFESAHCGC